jgi:hypothetical protein
MSFNAKFKLDGKELNLNIQTIDFGFKRGYNDRGEITTPTSYRGVTIVFEVAEDIKPLSQWITSSKTTRDVSIDFHGIKDGNQEVKYTKLEMKEAYLVSYDFSFARGGDVNTLLTLHISSTLLTFGGEDYESEARYQ